MRIRIAVVEDITEQYEYVHKLLKVWAEQSGESIAVTHVTCAEEYLISYSQPDTFDILFLDVYMKQMNGMELAKEIREKFSNKSIWLYTGGTWDEVKHMRVIPYLDVLCDGEFEVDKKDENTHWVGSTNQRVIDVQKTLAEGNVVLYED